jgi:Uma2 family endonuclease
VVAPPYLDHLRSGDLIPLPTGEDLLRAEADPVGHPVRFPLASELPHDDGEPMETPWHRENMNLLIDVIDTRWRGREDFFSGGNMFVYFRNRHVFNRDFRGPDFFVVNGGVDRRPRLSWIAWEEDGRLPDVIVELASESTLSVDRTVKKELYATRFKTHEYFVYDPATDRLEGWRLGQGAGYEPIAPDAAGRLWCEQIACSLGTWDGVYGYWPKRWLRMFEADGRLCPTQLESETAARQVEAAARQSAEVELARLRSELAALRNPPPTTT